MEQISNATTLYGIYVKIESAQNENIVYTVSVDLSTGIPSSFLLFFIYH